uniref:endo-polygalacturonase n=1 Tax=Phaedon cochleariae TaxID=80249 RepID=K7DWA3_PHACE|nr:glycoside hydrolase family 28 protein [Phaedon cochleariae]
MNALIGILLVSASTALSFSLKPGASTNCTITEISQVASTVKSCQDIVISNLVVPGGQILELDLLPGARVTFEGTTKFEYFYWAGPLIRVRGENVHFQGAKGSVLDGQGALWWDSKGGAVPGKPYMFEIDVTGGLFEDIFLLNCPHHCVIISSTDLTLDRWTVDVSEGNKNNLGHNTDGFDIIYGQNVTIKNSTVSNQDDCVAINRGQDMLISGMDCTGSHGLSISVGFSKHSFLHNRVANVVIENSVLRDGDNGIHVKTHTDGYLGEIRNITYRNIRMSGIRRFGAQIQQNYPSGSGPPVGNIPITNLTFSNITGTMSGKNSMPVEITCAENACIDWSWSDVSITHAAKRSTCSYVPKGFNC